MNSNTVDLRTKNPVLRVKYHKKSLIEIENNLNCSLIGLNGILLNNGGVEGESKAFTYPDFADLMILFFGYDYIPTMKRPVSSIVIFSAYN